MPAGSEGAGDDPWDLLASRYRWSEPLERRSLGALLDALGVRPDEVLLDVGTGTALVPRLLGREGRGPGAPTVAADRSAAMLALVPTDAACRVRAEATRLPLRDGTVDVVTAAWLLHLLDPEERRAAVAEVARVLRPGGRIGVVVPAEPRTGVQRAVRGLAQRATAGLGAYRVPRDLPRVLADHGLRVVSRRRTGLGYLADVLVAVRTA
ncbi:class I SAM-dependent methyltransferase [Aquipuribacter sp. SD81]|uniref:class I SAM-dependent methyltransferase n=1 Tax=Aquipuribacter sp. SD81 TaxID=3127703 RepID=UPI00301601E3